MTREVVLGRGLLSWDGAERRSDRYGAVALFDTVTDHQVEWATTLPAGTVGRLVAKVVETRRSGHLGDWARGIFPSTPEVGETVALGAGPLHYTPDGHVGVSRDDRRHDWLDPEALYRVHDQTVDLLFEVTR